MDFWADAKRTVCFQVSNVDSPVAKKKLQMCHFTDWCRCTKIRQRLHEFEALGHPGLTIAGHQVDQASTLPFTIHDASKQLNNLHNLHTHNMSNTEI